MPTSPIHISRTQGWLGWNFVTDGQVTRGRPSGGMVAKVAGSSAKMSAPDGVRIALSHCHCCACCDGLVHGAQQLVKRCLCILPHHMSASAF